MRETRADMIARSKGGRDGVHPRKGRNAYRATTHEDHKSVDTTCTAHLEDVMQPMDNLLRLVRDTVSASSGVQEPRHYNMRFYVD